MEHKVLQYANGRYVVNISITTLEWISMLKNPQVFYPDALKMALFWFAEEDHQATSKTIMCKYCPSLNGTPFNAIVKGLSTRILKYLGNRFMVEDSSRGGKTSYWSIPFEGWHEDYNPNKNFIWKVRDELVEAIEILQEQKVIDIDNTIGSFLLTNDNDIEGYGPIDGNAEGKRIGFYTTRYERNPKNRKIAIKNCLRKGLLCCEACGFNFEKTYGERGHEYIEVHHNKALSSLKQEVVIDPIHDLTCVCANCHRMIHRDKSHVLSIKELKAIIQKTDQQ